MTIQRLKFLLDNFEKEKLTADEQAELSAWYDSHNTWKGLIDWLDSDEQDKVRSLLWSNILSRLPSQEQQRQSRALYPLRPIRLSGQSSQQPADQEQDANQQNTAPQGSKQSSIPLRSSEQPAIPLQGAKQPRSRRITRLVAAASIIGLLSGGAILYSLLIRRGHSGADDLAAARHHLTNHSFTPGGNKALLTLADGKTITLDSASNGILDKEEGIEIDKKSDGQLVYEKTDALGSSASGQQSSEQSTSSGQLHQPIFNTLSTPTGGQYKVVLPDGTRVWLNAASTLRYPTAFTGAEREVLLNGEAYFEVVANKSMPFKVSTADHASIHVLGTNFNVMAYPDEESMKTTLLEGAVQVNSGGANDISAILKPGEQGSLKWHTGQLTTSMVDVEEAIAWKNGLFQFKSADIRTVMRQIARWYNAEVTYTGNIPEHFTGQAFRNEDISVILEILELTGNVRFVIDGRKITVVGK
jgi:transmembrane sensor